MEREDPSIRVVLEDPQTEETLVSGMGELHMEVVEDKLKRQFKLKTKARKMPSGRDKRRKLFLIEKSDVGRPVATFLLSIELDASRYCISIRSFGVGREYTFSCKLSGKGYSLKSESPIESIRGTISDNIAGFLVSKDQAHLMSDTLVCVGPDHVYKLCLKDITIEHI